MKHETVYSQITHEKVSSFAHEHRFPGWYIDSNGCYGCVIGRFWISIFVNDCDETLDITVDTIGEEGFFDQNLEWETPEDDDALAETARRFMAKYATKC